MYSKGCCGELSNKKNLTVVKGQKLLSKYQFNTKKAKHYFCSRCGIYTHHQRRSDPKEFGINMGCIYEFDFSSYGDILVMDGKNNHPSDDC